MTQDQGREVFRAGVGMVVLDREQDRVLALERSDVQDAWQLPQGGLEPGEAPEAAAWRELFEETALTDEHVRLVRSFEPWIGYELPAAMRSDKTGRGQVHRWFLFELRKGARLPPLPQSPGREFVAQRWIAFDELVEGAIAFRRPVYALLKPWVTAP